MATVRKYRGRWVADFRDQHGRRRIERPVGDFGTATLERRAAEELLARRKGEIQSHTFTPSRERMTVAELAERWMQSKVRARATTLSDYRIMLDSYVLPYFGSRKVETLHRLDIESFRADLAAGVPDSIVAARSAKLAAIRTERPEASLRPLAPGPRTVNKCLGVIVAMLGYAEKHGLVSRNVATRIEKLPAPQGEGRVIEQNVLTPDELRRVLAATSDPWRIPIAIAIYTGARQAEILGLKWGDIDRQRGTADIRRTYRCGAFYQPKTASSRRTVELPDVLLAELKRWQLCCPKGEHDLVCPGADGRPMSASSLLQSGFQPAVRRAGIRQVRFHDLRHSFASNLLAAGVDLATISAALGHANVRITLEVYSHSVPKARHGAADRMAALLSQSGNNLETSGCQDRYAAARTAA